MYTSSGKSHALLKFLIDSQFFHVLSIELVDIEDKRRLNNQVLRLLKGIGCLGRYP